MPKIILDFVSENGLQLCETRFSHPLAGDEKCCVRGKLSGAYDGYGTFQWTKAVQGLTLLLVRAKIHDAFQNTTPIMGPHLIGHRLSPAASLDYALDKQTTWLVDMFGCDKYGMCLARRMIKRTNSGRKRAGPVSLSLNTKFLETNDIVVMLDREPIADLQRLLELHRGIPGAEPLNLPDVQQSVIPNGEMVEGTAEQGTV